jgi:MFS family permease
MSLRKFIKIPFLLLILWVWTTEIVAQIPLELRQPGNTLLPEGTHILVLFKKSEGQQAADAGLLPSPGEYPERVWDYLDARGKTKKKYPTSSSSDKSIFVFALTPDDRLFFSSDHKNTPQFKNVVKGLIWVEATQETSETTQMVKRLLGSEIRLKLETTTGTSLPAGSKMLVHTKEGEASYRLEKEQLPSPSTGVWREDQLSTGQVSKESYPPSASIGRLYFIYVATPSGEVFYSSSQDGAPVFDQVVSGKILLSPLESTHPAFLAVMDGETVVSAEEQTPLQGSGLELPEQAGSSEWDTTPPLAFGLLSACILLAGFFLTYISPARGQWALGLLGFFATGLLACWVHMPFAERYRMLILFFGGGLAFGIYQTLRKRETNLLSTLQSIYTPAAASLGFSFFFFELIEGKVMEGSALNNLGELNIWLASTVALAAGAFVYAFSMGYLANGKDSAEVRSLTWISIPVFVVTLIAIDPFQGMPIAIIFLFIAAFSFLYVLIAESRTLKNFPMTLILLVLGFGMVTNFFVSFSLISIALYWVVENSLTKEGRLAQSHRQSARLLGLGGMVFHLMVFYSFILLKINLEEWDALPLDQVFMNSLLLGSFGLFAFSWAGYALSTNNDQ